MRAILLCMLLPVLWKCTYAGLWTNCQLEGLTSTDWLMSYTLRTSINDTYEGTVATFKTKNILEMTVESPVYLDATFENEVVTIFTTERFKDFEKEFVNSYESGANVKLNFECSDKKSDSITIHQKVIDINNHEPVLNKEHYEYNFAMTIPKGFYLTEFQTISASDDDFTNNNIYFTMKPEELRETLRLRREGRKNNREYFTSLEALKDITAPFQQEFTIVATDVGDPTKSTTAKVVVNVISPGEDSSSNETFVHPPVFSKYLYFADYTSDDDLKMEDTITIKFGATKNMIVRQSDFGEFFKISQNPSVEDQIDVKVIKALPDDILKNSFRLIEIEVEDGLSSPGRTSLIIRLPNRKDDEAIIHPPVFSKHLYFANYTADNKLKLEENITIIRGATEHTVVQQSGYEEFIKISLNTLNSSQILVEIVKPLNITVPRNELVIEIKAENEGLSIPGRTALLIHLPNNSTNEDCSEIYIWGLSYSHSAFVFIISLTAIIIIVLLNIIVISLYFHKQKKNVSISNQPTVEERF